MKNNNLIFPPSKKISFNAMLKNNDGLLANHIAVNEKLNYNQAVQLISDEIKIWNEQIENDTLHLDKIGQFKQNKEGNKFFIPCATQNYLTSSFGLPAIPIQSKVMDEQVENTSIERPKYEMNVLLKYAAGVAVIMTLGLSIWQFDQVNKKKNYTLEIINQDRINDKIEQATFNINQPLPTIKIDVQSGNEPKLNIVEKPFHIITGAFSIKENALKKINTLKAKGYESAQIIGQNKWGLHQVAINSYETKDLAKNAIASIRKYVSKDAWILTK